MTKVKHLKKCRICNSKNLTKIVKLSKMPFTDEFMTFKNIGKEFLHDINVFLCKDCQVVQTQHDVEVNKYYLDSQYSVAHSKIANKFMCLLANNINSFYFKKISKKSILEVGSGDGKQLHQFKKIGFDVLGYEPSKILSDIANKNKIKTINGLFTKDSLNLFKAQKKYFDVILLTYTFDHLPNPGEFLDISKKLLKKNGILVVEVHDLDKISKNIEFCLFEHEHSIYLNKSSATKFLSKYDLDIINFNLIEEKYRRANYLIFVAKRKDNQVDRWQMPQGGVNSGESYLSAMKRELFEETSIKSIELLKEIDGFFEYELPDNLVGIIWRGKFKGQKQKWFIVKFIGNEKEINLKTKYPEFVDWKWIMPDELPNVIVDFKRNLYLSLLVKLKELID